MIGNIIHSWYLFANHSSNWSYKYVPQSSFLQFFREYGYGMLGYPLVGGYHFGPILSRYELLFAGLKNVYAA